MEIKICSTKSSDSAVPWSCWLVLKSSDKLESPVDPPGLEAEGKSSGTHWGLSTKYQVQTAMFP